MKKWEAIFTEADREVMKSYSLGFKQQFGPNPALLIIDVTRSFIGSTKQPVVQAVQEYSMSCGEVGWRSVEYIRELLEHCRVNRVPVIYTRADLVTQTICKISAIKRPLAGRELEEEGKKIVESIAPLPSELVIYKTRSSAFFRTQLDIVLKAMDVDSLLIAGTSTSGCVRASVVDALSNGFKCFVVEECCFDRFELSHLVSLFDMNGKYADVISLEEAKKYVSDVVNLKKSSQPI